MALNVSGGAFGDQPDGWWCSALRDHTNWTPSIATQCANGRLLDSPGAIRAGVPLGSDIVAYKNTSMYLGRYQGGQLIWTWTRVPGDVGCSGPESVVVVDTRHFFVGPSDFFVFDGTVPRSIGAPVREWFFANLHATYRDRVVGVADLPRDLVYWYYPSTASTSGALDSVLIYNFRKDRWGKQALSIDAALQYSSGQVTWDGLGALYSTYDDLPNIAYDSTFWLADSTIPGVFQGTTLYSVNGAPGASWFRTGDFGDMTDYSYLSRVTPRYRTKPATGTAMNFYRDDLGTSPTQDATTVMSRGRFDFRRDARWHSVRVDHVAAAVVNGIDVDIEASSEE